MPSRHHLLQSNKKYNMFHKVYVLAAAMLFCSGFTMALQCPKCGNITVPYPLSTGTDCGDQDYKVRCIGSTLWFQGLNGSSYLIKSINPLKQTMLIQPAGFAKSNTCISADFPSQGLLLNRTLPFNITRSNTFLYLNCSDRMLQTTYDCSPTNPCHNYLKYNTAAASCKASKVCCWFKAGGVATSFRIYAQESQCSAYTTFVNLDPGKPVSKWPEPGVEIIWAMPREPLCNSQEDCSKLANSTCSPDDMIEGEKRCFCNPRYHWDPYDGVCTKHLKCRGKACQRRKRQKALIGGFTSTAGAILIVAIIIVILRQKRKKLSKEAQESLNKAREEILNASNSGGKFAKVYTSKEITKATNNFSKENLLGAGGFGEVFKATFEDGTITAVKRAKVGNSKGIDQILNEVRILCQVNHRSLVRILGCCVELDHPLLVYEYVPNGTLYDHLHGAYSGKWPSLNWQTRLKIGHQTAEALAYLHSSASTPIYHRDIKTSNILLDEKLNAKVSDFGLSRLGIETDATHITTCAQGTLGYLDPEYYLNFHLTDKSDVYSFGVVLLELLTSKKAIDFNREEEEVNLVVYMKNMLREERLMDAIDPVLKNGASKVDTDSMKALGYLAGACIDERRQNRPSMKGVADEIEYISSVVNDEET